MITQLPIARPPRLIAIASGKGGVGKTWLSATLAHALAQENERVLLFDGDLGLANIDVQLGLTPTNDLGAVISGRMTLAEAVTPFAGGASEGGFDVLAGRSGSGALAHLNRAEIGAMAQSLKLLATHYDRTIVDLGAGLDLAVLGLTAACDTTLVVLTEEPTSLTDAYALIKIMNRAGDMRDTRVVVNMAQSEEAGRKTWGALANACRNFLGLEPPLAGVIRRDEKIKEAIRRQTAFLTRHPAAPAAADVTALARSLGKPQALAPDSRAKALGGLK
ncbi:MAG: MinD/ParA family protein [Alphaproteobacteria bacterium]|nr:MinD/ParA family protein [Alphaproteobacteria bacterium]